MARPPKRRLVERLPVITYFKPQGIPMSQLSEVVLTVEELESIRLVDLEELDQEVCAEKMNVSRPTFHRILNSARKKISQALINGLAIRVDGGNFQIALSSFLCGQCGHKWQGTFCHRHTKCPQCQSKDWKVDQ
ncbi:DUF134 domain-containing protein [Desulforamulus ruminis]|uniref:UPF0251 protein Desru_2684 n=1 Tax=Desulforamulus ruminis (strain ATCC 23193 / DSM 2154 / NCIMB 8452 / DL) TaxID=696281 RepID=F6DR75_DESRL|nr:DUF134 domain-containing protein [Desulforamulus ruminis]AEG60910.1 protein of unknown function DUF134 [Desulforamulus ruminis DSM 2154]